MLLKKSPLNSVRTEGNKCEDWTGIRNHIINMTDEHCLTTSVERLDGLRESKEYHQQN